MHRKVKKGPDPCQSCNTSKGNSSYKQLAHYSMLCRNQVGSCVSSWLSVLAGRAVEPAEEFLFRAHAHSTMTPSMAATPEQGFTIKACCVARPEAAADQSR